jgi:hypothetical protein
MRMPTLWDRNPDYWDAATFMKQAGLSPTK